MICFFNKPVQQHILGWGTFLQRFLEARERAQSSRGRLRPPPERRGRRGRVPLRRVLPRRSACADLSTPERGSAASASEAIPSLKLSLALTLTLTLKLTPSPWPSPNPEPDPNPNPEPDPHRNTTLNRNFARTTTRTQTLTVILTLALI